MLDLIYLQPGGDAPAYLNGLRLQNLERLNIETLRRQAAVFNTPKMHRACEEIVHLTHTETEEYEAL